MTALTAHGLPCPSAGLAPAPFHSEGEATCAIGKSSTDRPRASHHARHSLHCEPAMPPGQLPSGPSKGLWTIIYMKARSAQLHQPTDCHGSARRPSTRHTRSAGSTCKTPTFPCTYPSARGTRSCPGRSKTAAFHSLPSRSACQTRVPRPSRHPLPSSCATSSAPTARRAHRTAMSTSSGPAPPPMGER